MKSGTAARAFFTRARTVGPAPVEVPTDRVPVYPRVIENVVPRAGHVTEQYARTSLRLTTAGPKCG